jgi:protocatechuate 3,4-dioxygenase beta subunit
MTERRRGRWILPALVCAAMLVVPILAWLFAPKPPRFVPPPRASSAVAKPARPEPPSTPSAGPHREAVRPARAPQPSAPAVDPDAPVSGVVLDPDGRPVKAAFVGCEDHDPPLVTTSDDEGAFHLAAEAAGCLAVARLTGLVDSDRVALVAGGENTLRLNRMGGIEGDVVDERGAPLAAFVVAIESYQGPHAASAPRGQSKNIQDKSGAYAFDHLVPGQYVLTASVPGRPPARSRPVDVDIGRTTSYVRITVGRGATLSGRVVDARTHKPLAGAVVTVDGATLTSAPVARPARSDDQGAYTLEGVPSTGPFSLRVVREGYRPRIFTGMTARGAATMQADLELNASDDKGGQDFSGIGAGLAPASNGVSFGSLVPDGPAEQAGLHVGDVIRRIDGADASSMSLVEIMQTLRGPDGSRVTVQVDRAGEVLEISVQRRAIRL